MIASAELADLVTLDRRRLHVFVAGPGYGEGIAVAFPGRGWLLVDGCEVERRIPLLSILDRWRGPDDPVDCLALTHPHKDHAGGFRRVLETTAPLTLRSPHLPTIPPKRCAPRVPSTNPRPAGRCAAAPWSTPWPPSSDSRPAGPSA